MCTEVVSTFHCRAVAPQLYMQAASFVHSYIAGMTMHAYRGRSIHSLCPGVSLAPDWPHPTMPSAVLGVSVLEDLR